MLTASEAIANPAHKLTHMIKAILFDLQGVLYTAEGLNEDLAAFIRQKKDDYIMAAVTASGDFMKKELQKDGLLDEFALVWTNDDTPLAKNDPHLYEKVAETLEVQPEEILFLDDVSSFVRAARKAGLRAIHYKGPKDFTLEHHH